MVLRPMGGGGVKRSDGGARAYGEGGGEVRRWCFGLGGGGGGEVRRWC